MSKEQRKMFRELAEYSQVGMTFAFSIIIGFGIGWFLDNKVFHGSTAPYLSFLFLGVGIVAGFKNLWDLKNRISGD